MPVETEAGLSSGDPVAAGLRGFGPLGILAFLVIILGNLVVVPLSAVLVLVWALRSRTPWREMGLALVMVLVHMVCVGLPIALVVRRYGRRA